MKLDSGGRCRDLWHITLSIRHEKCPTCGGTWKREADDSISSLLGAIAGADDKLSREDDD